METITQEQYYLASKANISIEESNGLPDFEKDAFIGLIIKEKKDSEKKKR